MTAARARHLNLFLAIAIVAVPVVFVWGLLWPGRRVDATGGLHLRGRAFANHKFAGADFVGKRDGVCRLSPQIARAVATLVATPNK